MLRFFSKCNVSDILPGLQCLPDLLCLLRGKALGDANGQGNFAVTIIIMNLETVAGDVFSRLFRSKHRLFTIECIGPGRAFWADTAIKSWLLGYNNIRCGWSWHSHKPTSS